MADDEPEIERQDSESVGATAIPPPAEDVTGSRAAVAELQARLADIEDRWKRTAAELDNYRKRMDREIVRVQQAEREAVLRGWLAVIDNMERALCAEGASNNPWYEGMEAIHQQMLSVLAQFGVKPDVPMGESFDPVKHDAVATANIANVADGTIVDVVQTGYLLDGKVLRPAKVVAVRKG